MGTQQILSDLMPGGTSADVYEIRKPCAFLSPYIDYYWRLNLTNSTISQVLEERVPTNGFHICYNISGKKTLFFNNQPYAFASGFNITPRDKPLVSIHASGAEIFGIKFRLSLPVFSQEIPQYCVMGSPHNVTPLLHERLVRGLLNAACFEERVCVAENILMQLTESNPKWMRQVNSVLEITLEMENNVLDNNRVSHLASRHYLHSKTVYRLFKNLVGTTPKTYQQNIRANRALKGYFSSPKQFDVQKYGYYDLSHFLKDMQSFTDNRFRYRSRA